MLNILYPQHPRIDDFGIRNDEISKIESYVATPKKKGNRGDKLNTISMMLYYIIFAVVLFFHFTTNSKNEQPLYTTIIVCMILPILYSLTIIIPLIGIGIIHFILNIIIPKSILPDKDVYDEYTLSMIEKKQKLEQYQLAEKQYQEEIEQIKKDYPLSDRFFSVGLNGNDSRYKQCFKAYIKHIATETFLPILKESVKEADRIEEKRSSIEWWENLTPFEFEQEVGKWYQNKGYIANVTRESNDGGVDVVLRMNKETTYVQCKQWNYQVPVGVVRELYGVMASKGVKKGIIVCLKGGTKGAVDFANDNGIRIVTHNDFVRQVKHVPTVYESKDINNYWKYGKFFIMYDAWSSCEDAIEAIKTTNYTSRNFVVGLSKIGAFYIGVMLNIAEYNRLSCFDYVFDAENFKILYENPRYIPTTSNSHYTYKKNRKRGRWYGKGW